MLQHSFSKATISAFLAMIAFCSLTGCFSENQSPIGQKEIKELERLLSKIPSDEIKQRLGQIIDNPDQSIEEIKKLRQVEYKLFSVAVTTPQQELENFLNSHGKERWDCSTLAQNNDSFTFICKRPTDSPLRLLPRSVLGQ